MSITHNLSRRKRKKARKSQRKREKARESQRNREKARESERKPEKEQNGKKAMNGVKNTKDGVQGTKTEQPRGKWMATGIGAGAALGILFGSFVLGPAIGSQTTGYILGMSMGAAIGLVSGLSLSSGKNHK